LVDPCWLRLATETCWSVQSSTYASLRLHAIQGMTDDGLYTKLTNVLFGAPVCHTELSQCRLVGRLQYFIKECHIHSNTQRRQQTNFLLDHPDVHIQPSSQPQSRPQLTILPDPLPPRPPRPPTKPAGRHAPSTARRLRTGPLRCSASSTSSDNNATI
jgi:hypothetical protein